MEKLWYIAGMLGLAGLASVLVYSNNEKPRLQIDTSVGAALYAANCASCHGANLQGEPDWQTTKPDGFLPAPPHDENGHTWHHADRVLLDYIKLGGAAALAKSGVENFQSGMPAFEEVLSSDEIDALLDYIKSTWPENIRTVQQDRTKLDTLTERLPADVDRFPF